MAKNLSTTSMKVFYNYKGVVEPLTKKVNSNKGAGNEQ